MVFTALLQSQLEKVFLEKKQQKKQHMSPNPARVVILVCNTLSRPVLHFYHVSPKYSEEYSCYRVDTKSNSNTRRGDNSKTEKAKVVILVCDTSSHPVVHYYKVSSQYSKGYSTCRVATESMHYHRQI